MASPHPGPGVDRAVFHKVLRELRRLSPRARRLDVEVAVWRAVARHAGAAGAEQIAEISWQILRRLAGARPNAA